MEKNEALEKILSWFENQISQERNTDIFQVKSKHMILLENKYQIYLKCITWKELLDINSKCFGKNSEGNYFNTEKQKRLILNVAIEKIIDIETNQIFEKDILQSLNYETVEYIWNEYQSILHLSSEEVSMIYSSTKNYFNESEDKYLPVLPEILEIDYILKGIVSLSRSEFNSMTNKEFEIMQLVLATKNELKS